MMGLLRSMTACYRESNRQFSRFLELYRSKYFDVLKISDPELALCAFSAEEHCALYKALKRWLPDLRDPATRGICIALRDFHSLQADVEQALEDLALAFQFEIELDRCHGLPFLGTHQPLDPAYLNSVTPFQFSKY